MKLAHEDMNPPNAHGLPLVLLHAFPLSRAMFDEVVGVLVAASDGPRVIRPDLRGFGESPLGGDEPSLDRMADDVAELLGDLGIERCVLGGLSMGGYVTMAMLRRHRELVDSVVLMDTKAGADADDARANRLRMAEAVTANGTRVLRPMLQTLLGETTRSSRPHVVNQVTGWLDAADPAAVAWAQRAMADRPESFDILRESGVRGSVIVGEEDVMSTRDDAQAMAEAFAETAPVHVITRAGHLSSVEAPADVVSAMSRRWT